IHSGQSYTAKSQQRPGGTPMTIEAAIQPVQEKFSVELAKTPGATREAPRLRHQVYCVEHDYLDDQDGLEVDEFDRHAEHVILRERATGEVVGAVRLVVFQPDAPGARVP